MKERTTERRKKRKKERKQERKKEITKERKKEKQSKKQTTRETKAKGRGKQGKKERKKERKATQSKKQTKKETKAKGRIKQRKKEREKERNKPTNKERKKERNAKERRTKERQQARKKSRKKASKKERQRSTDKRTEVHFTGVAVFLQIADRCYQPAGQVQTSSALAVRTRPTPHHLTHLANAAPISVSFMSGKFHKRSPYLYMPVCDRERLDTVLFSAANSESTTPPSFRMSRHCKSNTTDSPCRQPRRLRSVSASFVVMAVAHRSSQPTMKVAAVSISLANFKLQTTP
jgi:hypothetical protein